ncbi:MAG: 3-hydroxybutyrate dehydrogenase [Steroidobacteraceae bacterium]|jgi:3-hydroxybutyrate dehydrogenase|nr:3-hydroxybutyrate dehydrogenase [Steroidobacteraceae bacterium]
MSVPHLQPRIALVTGAASGIGRGLALQLGAAGWQVAVTDLDAAAVDAVASEIRDGGGRASAHRVDVADAPSVAAAVAALPGPVALLVNAAGLQHVAPLESFDLARFRLLIDVMLTGAAITSAAVLPGMRAAGRGRIVHVGSIHSLVASPYKSAYVAAKHGLVGLARTLALETADLDVTVNVVCPAYVRTPLVDNQIAAQARERGITPEQVIEQVMLKPMPKRRFIEIEEIAATVEFLAGDAARNITGQCITLDGGWTAQ